MASSSAGEFACEWKYRNEEQICWSDSEKSTSRNNSNEKKRGKLKTVTIIAQPASAKWMISRIEGEE